MVVQVSVKHDDRRKAFQESNISAVYDYFCYNLVLKY